MDLRKVMKFGGAALADGPGVERVCRIVRERGGDRPIVVVSAHQGVTSLLESLARAAAAGGEGDLEGGDRVRIRHKGLLRQLGLDSELLNRYFAELASLLGEIRRRGRLLPGERDLVLSYGERMSARVVAHTLKLAGVPATPVDAFDLGLTTDSNHGAARPLPGNGALVREALLAIPGVPVVTGFLAKDRLGNLTTLGRNGSDLTASLVAEAVGARELELWKAVGGMMTADPAIVPDARVVERLSFEEAAEFAAHGADILHPDALAPAQRAGVTVRFLDVTDPSAPGTVLDSHDSVDGPIGIAGFRRLLRITCSHEPLGESSSFSSRLADLAVLLARHGVEPVACSVGRAKTELLVVPGPQSDGLLAEIARAAELGRMAHLEKDLALVAVVGFHATERIARSLAILADLGVAVREARVGPERRAQVFLIDAADLERAVRGIHAALFSPQATPVP